MKIVIIESPFAGKCGDRPWMDIERNLQYVRAAMRDSLLRGEAPYASHALYTQNGVLDDKNPTERALGIAAGFVFRSVANLTAVYQDLGVTEGMKLGIEDAEKRGCPIEYRNLEGWSSQERICPK